MALIREVLHLPMDYDSPLILNAKLLRSEKEHCLALFEQRVQTGKPVPYLINKALFAGFEFYCDERVLVPRSPIAELIAQQFAPFLPQDEASPEILDLCCGSGCIGLATALSLEGARVSLSDIDPEALEVADMNAVNLGLDEQVSLIESNLFRNILPKQQFSLIVSNPPYVGEDEMQSLPEEFLHEPEHALACDNNGLSLTEEILRKAASYLTPEGILIVEVGNSWALLEERYPELPFQWLEFENGGYGVFMLRRAQLISYFGDNGE
jgi:ribosomal protein L3 glutamine methyltransferase